MDRGGKVAGWVRVKSCLLKGSCHQPPQPCSFTPAFQIHANLLRAVSTGALGNKGTGWFMQPVEAQALGPPGTLLQAREVSQKPPRAQPAESKDEAGGMSLHSPANPVAAMKGWERAVVEEKLTALCFLPSTCAHRAPGGRVTSDAQPGG